MTSSSNLPARTLNLSDSIDNILNTTIDTGNYPIKFINNTETDKRVQIKYEKYKVGGNVVWTCGIASALDDHDFVFNYNGVEHLRVDTTGDITTIGDIKGTTPTEMSFLSGVTSSIQAQINNKRSTTDVATIINCKKTIFTQSDNDPGLIINNSGTSWYNIELNSTTKGGGSMVKYTTDFLTGGDCWFSGMWANKDGYSIDRSSSGELLKISNTDLTIYPNIIF